MSTAIALVTEFLLPILFLLPIRRSSAKLRAVLFSAQLLLQMAIGTTGSYGFFNFLTAATSIPLLVGNNELNAQWTAREVAVAAYVLAGGVVVWCRRLSAQMLISYVSMASTGGIALGVFEVSLPQCNVARSA